MRLAYSHAWLCDKLFLFCPSHEAKTSLFVFPKTLVRRSKQQCGRSRGMLCTNRVAGNFVREEYLRTRSLYHAFLFPRFRSCDSDTLWIGTGNAYCERMTREFETSRGTPFRCQISVLAFYVLKPRADYGTPLCEAPDQF